MTNIEKLRDVVDLLSSLRGPDQHDGGTHYPEFIATARQLMDQVKAAGLTDAVAVEAISRMQDLANLLASVETEEWNVPMWTRFDVPSQGNITIPPIKIDRIQTDEVWGAVTFSRYHLGGGSAVHGGQIGVAFDHILSLAAMAHTASLVRTLTLTTRFHSLTPLDSELILHSQVEKSEGRRVEITASLRDRNRLYAEADALFLSVPTPQ